ncbi:MAG: 50S ribosomal protein L31 [Anaerolineae bacterium]|nr:50S ribosomal protein L31 [Anaerolineae bacterium]MDW8102610.1 50S ribosomal protein L31 [Anaerolineae bacterium]
MKKGIHPEFYTDAQVICACGNTFITGATKKVIRTDVCSACHPFFTGEQRIVDTGGQVERFKRRAQKTEELSRKKEEG